MRTNLKTTVALSALAVIAVRPFKNEPGWKMDGDKLATDSNGNPIYVDSDGKETATDHGTIARLNAEAKKHREDKETAEKALKKFDGLDPETARKAVDTVAKMDAKTLIDAGEVDRVKEQIKSEFTQQLTEAQERGNKLESQLNDMRIGGVFSNSEFVRNDIAVPTDMFEATFRNNFKIEDGAIVAYDRSGNRLMSKDKPGNYAEPDEAIRLLVEQHPQKDSILKAAGTGGTGNSGGGGNRGGGGKMKRSEFDALAPGAKATAAGQVSKGELTLID